MAAQLIFYSRLLAYRLLRPLQLIKPILQLIKVRVLISLLILIELTGSFWPFTKELKIKNNLAAWPRSKSAQKYSELILLEPKKLLKEKDLWENFIKNQTESRDALLQLSVLSYRLYDDKSANLYWERLVYLDPGFAASQLFRPPLVEH